MSRTDFLEFAATPVSYAAPLPLSLSHSLRKPGDKSIFNYHKNQSFAQVHSPQAACFHMFEQYSGGGGSIFIGTDRADP